MAPKVHLRRSVSRSTIMMMKGRQKVRRKEIYKDIVRLAKGEKTEVLLFVVEFWRNRTNIVNLMKQKDSPACCSVATCVVRKSG